MHDLSLLSLPTIFHERLTFAYDSRPIQKPLMLRARAYKSRASLEPASNAVIKNRYIIKFILPIKLDSGKIYNNTLLDNLVI